MASESLEKWQEKLTLQKTMAVARPVQIEQFSNREKAKIYNWI